MAKSRIRIRGAQLDDLDALISLGERARFESLNYFPPIERDISARVLEAVIENPNLGFAAIAEDDDPIGMIFGIIGQYPFSSVKYAIQTFFYVAPEHRGSRAAFLLLKAFEAWAAPLCQAFLLGQHTGLGTLKSLERHGYKPYGVQYIKWDKSFLS